MQVTVYSTPTCPYCKLAKKFLEEHDVAFTDIDVSADGAKAQEMIDKTKQMGVPVIEISAEGGSASGGGDTIIVGYDEKKLRKALKIE